MRADRLLSILLLLQVNRRLTARELARRLEVSERTILRDMDALSGAGVPVVAERGAGGGWGLLEEYQTKLTGLNTAEIQTLFVARPPKLMADLGLQQESEAAWIKLQAALPAGVRQQAEFVRQRILVDARGWRDPGESVTALPVLLDALWRERRIRFVYRAAMCEPGERSVDPLGLVARGSVWYLLAGVNGDTRTYRVSRISSVTILDEASARPPDFDLAAWWERSSAEFRQQLPRYYATFLVDEAVLPWVRYRGWRVEQESAESGCVRMRVRFDAEEEAVQFALGLGADVEVLEPLELRDKVLQKAHALVRLYAGAAAGKSRAESSPDSMNYDRPVVCIDLDGVMNQFDGWRGADYFHPPRPGLKEFIQSVRDLNYLVVVHTVRWVPHVWEWIRTNSLDTFIDDVTNQKIPAHVYIDDRAICFRGNFAETLEMVKSFKAHWEENSGTDF